MQNYICWEESSVVELLNPEAEYLENEVFAAVHHPMLMSKRLMKGNTSNTAYTQQEFLKDFLKKEFHHRLVPVLGISGSGKSHMIRWLKTHIPTKEGREVILIPKANTNLREILSMILSNREGEEFDLYRKRLVEANDDINANAGASLLLDSLAQKVEFLSLDFYLQKLDNSKYDVELIEYIKDKLPYILRDNHIRKVYWLIQGGVINRLYNLAVGKTNSVERLDAPRLFSVYDLPLKLEDRNKSAESARDFLEELYSSEDFQDLAVQVLNLTLNEAIKELLIGKEDLTKLFLDVRRYLYKHNVELILLIEDFAKMQGIDGALLEALIQQSRPGEDPLCILRTALACTDGYYESIPDTVKTRTSFTVHINYDEEQSINYDAFVAKYLNAVRLGKEKLKVSFNEYQVGRSQSYKEWEVPNPCITCQFKEECHAGFGTYEGVGLYPLNSYAVQRMYNKIKEGKAFNPRQFISRFLQVVMHQHAPRIAQGLFPNLELLDQFGGTTISAKDRNELQNKFGRAKVEKLFPLIEFWSSDGRNLNALNHVINDAFELDLNGLPEPQPKLDPNLEPVSIQDPNQKQDSYPQIFNEIERWSNGNRIGQVSQNLIRNALRRVIFNYINWDDLGLIPVEFDDFKARAILFLEKAEDKLYTEVTLALPLSEDERVTSAIALQGLMLYQHYGNWNFDKDRTFFLAFAKYLDKWSQHVLDQMLTHSKERSDWNPVKSVIQWLYLAGRMNGSIKAKETSLADIWIKINNEAVSFQGLEARTAAWRYICNKISNPGSKVQLIEKLYHYTLCPKGGSKQLKVFDVVKVIPLLEEVHKNSNRLLLALPQDLSPRFNFLELLNSAFNDKIDSALKEEIERYTSWKAEITNAIGLPTEFMQNIMELKQIFQEAVDNGYAHVLQGEDYLILETFLNGSITADLHKAYRNANHIENIIDDIDGNFDLLLSRVGRTDVVPIMKDSLEAFKIAARKLKVLESQIDNDISLYQGATAAELTFAKDTIDQSLKNLINFVEGI